MPQPTHRRTIGALLVVTLASLMLLFLSIQPARVWSRGLVGRVLPSRAVSEKVTQTSEVAAEADLDVSRAIPVCLTDAAIGTTLPVDCD
ncbi:MAG: hypothetical protein AB7N70_18800, partial [Dehalococcoidia bacterium]